MVDLGILLAYVVLAWVLWGYMRRVQADASRNVISRRQYVWLLAASSVLLIRFVILGDPGLIAGQAGLLILLGAFGYDRQRSSRPVQQSVAQSPQPTKKSATAPAASTPKRHRRRRAAIVLLLLIIATVIISRQISAPTTGSIQVTDTPTKTTTIKQVSFSGQHFSFQHPESFTQNKVDPPKPPLVEQYDFLKRGGGQAELAIQIESLPSSNLIDSGSYHFRQAHPERFSETNISVNGMSVHVMTDNTSDASFARVAYFQHDGYLASVALTGSTGNVGASDSADVFQAVLDSWSWR